MMVHHQNHAKVIFGQRFHHPTAHFFAFSFFCKTGFYRGWSMTMAYAIPGVALNFFAFDMTKRKFFNDKVDPKNGRLPVFEGLFCGAIAGFTSSITLYPLDLVRRQMQMNQMQGRRKIHKGNWDAIRHVYKNDNGLRGFYRGIVPELFKVVPNIAIIFCVFERLMAHQWPMENVWDDRIK